MRQNDAPLLVSALIVTRKNAKGETEILNVRAHNKTKYGFPGGKIEEGEAPIEAVIRETIEELGAKPSNLVQLGLYSALTPEGRGINMYVFSGAIASDIGPNAEIAELHWLTYSQMLNNVNLLTPMTIEYVMPLLKEV